jgi:signal peptidase II
LAVDQATKAIAVARLGARSVPAIDGILHWTLQRNPGSAFGLFQRLPILFTVLAAGIAIAILVNVGRVRDSLTAVAMGLVLGGAIGNLADRLVRAPGIFRGRVIDFIDFRVWPVFNVADSAVVVGAFLLIVASYRSERRSKAREQTDG